MATHILEEPAPTINPTGASSNDYEQINASPEAFGAAIGRADQGLGQAVTQAGTTGLDILTQRQTQQNEVHAADLQTWLSNKHTDTLSQFSRLEGQAAQNALPAFKANIHDSYQEALSQAGNDQSKVLIAKAGAALTDQYYKYGTIHADGEYKKWQDTSDTLHASDQGTQSTRAALFGDMHGADAFLAASNNVIRTQAQQRGYDEAATDQLVRANTGAHVANTIEQLAVTGVKGSNLPGTTIAQEYFKKYRDQMDPASQLRTEEFLKTRTDQQEGIAAGQKALGAATATQAGHGYANPTLPIFATASSTAQGGLSPAGLARTVQIESGGNPAAGNGSHLGLGQFSPSTWAKYGEGSRTDPEQSILATARYSADNARYLSSALGRAPTDAELYLAHQQGAGGAAKLLANPNARAGDLVGDAAIRGNGGDPNAPASAFTGKWVAKFGGNGLPVIVPGGGQTFTLPPSVSGAQRSAPTAQPLAPENVPDAAPSPAPLASAATTAAPTLQTQPDQAPQPTSIRGDAYAQINDQEASGALSHEAAQHARTYVSQQIAAKQIAEESDARSRKVANDASANTYVSRMLNGDTKGLLESIANDPHLNWETRRSLGDAVEKQAGEGPGASAKTYGSGFFDALKGITAQPDDPARINDVTSLLPRVQPGGDLTLSGWQKLRQVQQESARSVDDAAVHSAKASLISYGRSKLSFDQETLVPGVPPLKDPKGQQIFEAQFVPKFEAAYDEWRKAGKNPWDFLTQDNVDKVIKGMRSPTEMAQAKIAAGASAVNPGAAPPPPVPDVPGIKPEGWATVLAAPVKTADGKPYPTDQWANAMAMLARNPTAQTVQAFNASKFGRAGYDAAHLLSAMGIKPPVVEPPALAAPSVPPLARRPAEPVERPRETQAEPVGEPGSGD